MLFLKGKYVNISTPPPPTTIRIVSIRIEQSSLELAINNNSHNRYRHTNRLLSFWP